MLWIRLILVLLLAAAACGCAANPYGVAGAGVLQTLGMPADSWDYSWDTLVAANPVNMVRPCKYWLSLGLSHRYWGYHETTDTIDDPVQFANYVTAHPGKIWIIGNEPDIGSQDGLTQEEYARMFHTYHAFIKGLDPTAKFAVGAVSGGSNASGLSYTISWYQGVLDIYRSRFGVAMPVDIWNVHSYVRPTQIEDPDRIITEFVTPLVNWCRTVENGAYAGCEVWITELPIGEWMGAVSEDNVIWFMQHYMPRLEQTGVTRWFWYVSSDWDGKQGSCALTRSGQVTPVGAAYAALANSYPNPVPPVEPFSPYAPALIEEFDFS
ncbi:MAG: glycosyl hydrolase, partial [Armatimonadota bacterium]